MPRKKIVEDTAFEYEVLPTEEVKTETEREKLLKLLQTLKDLKINSIGDLENQISRL